MKAKIDIKPLSVNRAYQGRRFKTKEYHVYERAVLLLLPKFELPEPPYKLSITFGMSNTLSDVDNPTKCTVDIMQTKYGFNDRDIFEMHLKKVKVPKGSEYFEFELSSL